MFDREKAYSEHTQCIFKQALRQSYQNVCNHRVSGRLSICISGVQVCRIGIPEGEFTDMKALLGVYGLWGRGGGATAPFKWNSLEQ